MVRAGWILSLALWMACPVGPLPGARAWASPRCPTLEHLELSNINLPRARASVTRERKLVILTLGGASTMGRAAGDPDAAYPARLQAELRAALPGIDVRVLNKASTVRGRQPLPPDLPAVIADAGARLVIWASGSREAVRGTDIDDYIASLQAGIALIRQAGADVILVDPQYAPSIARITNTEPYREALNGVAVAHDVGILHRYDLMMWWNDSGAMNLDAQDAQERLAVARHLYACIAAALAPPIAQAVQ